MAVRHVGLNDPSFLSPVHHVFEILFCHCLQVKSLSRWIILILPAYTLQLFAGEYFACCNFWPCSIGHRYLQHEIRYDWYPGS